MDISPKQYWFPAKRYGWGWGLPTTWQGWAVLISYLVVIGLVSVWVPPSVNPDRFWGLVFLATVALGVIVWRKGEPPGWHWGG